MPVLVPVKAIEVPPITTNSLVASKILLKANLTSVMYCPRSLIPGNVGSLANFHKGWLPLLASYSSIVFEVYGASTPLV